MKTPTFETLLLDVDARGVARLTLNRPDTHNALNAKLIAELRQHVATKIGAIARPKSIVLTDDLPKTRSGKIMRRLLRDISENRKLGDVTTLANEEVVSEISGLAASARASDEE